MRPGVLAAIPLLLSLALVAACSHHPKSVATPEPPSGPSSKVDRNQLEAAASTRMQLSADQVFIPGELSNPEVMPAYPAALLPQLLPDQTVCVRFSVNTDGSVANIVPVTDVEGCPTGTSEQPPEFLGATIDAVSQWDFYSFVRCTFPPGTPDALKCNGPGAVAEQVAVTLGYRFLFSAKSGVTTVRE